MTTPPAPAGIVLRAGRGRGSREFPETKGRWMMNARDARKTEQEQLAALERCKERERFRIEQQKLVREQCEKQCEALMALANNFDGDVAAATRELARLIARGRVLEALDALLALAK